MVVRSSPPADSGYDHQPAMWARWLPGADVLLHYRRRWLRPDLLAGLTVAAYLVPQVMAYAEIAGLPAVVGLWAIIIPLTLYALVGTSSQLSVGPESTTALMTAAGIAALVGRVGPDRATEVAAVMAIAVGLVAIAAWILRFGFVADLLSRPVLIGYMAGIGILMIVSQLGTLTGVEVEGDQPWEKVASLARQWSQTHVPTLAIGLVVIVVLFATNKWFPTAPGPLIAMLGAALAVALFDLGDHGVHTIGEVPSGLPLPRVPALGDIRLLELIPYAVGITIVAYSDNVLTGRAFASKRSRRIDADQELLALGIVNVANGFANGMPVSSSASRTVLGDAMGSRTQLHSLVAVAIVIATLLFLDPLLAAFPTAALAGVVVYAAVRLIDGAELQRLGRFRASELILALITTLAVVTLGVLNGIGLAVALSMLDLIRRIAKPHDAVLGYVPGLPGMHDIDDYDSAQLVPGLVIYRYDSPLFFANAEDFLARALVAVDDADPRCDWFVLNAEANMQVDLTAIDALAMLCETLTQRGIRFAMARVKQDLRDDLDAAGFVARVGPEYIFPTLPTAVYAYATWYEHRNGERPPGLPPGSIIPPVVPVDGQEGGSPSSSRR